MTKKILAGVLTAASILSISSVASAATTPYVTGETVTKKFDPATGASYSVSMDVTYGTVSAEIPDVNAFSKAYLNPYKATVKTIQTTVTPGTAGDGSDDTTADVLIAKNNSQVASGVFAIKNLDTEENLLVVAKTKISKATGVVVKNPASEVPFGWAKVANKSDTDYDYLTDYDKLTLKDSAGKAVKAPAANATAAEITAALATVDAKTSTGGKESTKQGKNIGMWLVGGYVASDLKTGSTVNSLVSEKFGDTTSAGTTNLQYVEFDPKLECSGDLMTVDAADTGYFMLGGQLSETAKDSIDDVKDNVKFSVVFKLIPQPATTP